MDSQSGINNEHKYSLPFNKKTRAINDIANKIVDDIFQLYQCHHTQSESDVHSETHLSSGKSFVDRRLQYWKDMLRRRRALQRRLCQATGKTSNEMLFNLAYDKNETFKRIVSYDELSDTTSSTDTEKHTKSLEYLREVKSVFLDPRSSSNAKSMENLQEFCPDLKALKVIGKSCWPCNQNEAVRQPIGPPACLSEENVETIENVKHSSLCAYSTKTRGTMTMTLSVLINGTSYCRYRPEYSPILERMFVCSPYEKNLRTIMRIENNGQRELTFNWERSNFFAYNNTLFNTEEEVFVFDNRPFLLRSGEVREVIVLFRPTKLGITKQRWLLTTKPRIFFRCPKALTLNMHGRCKPPQEYLELMACQMAVPVQKYRRSPKTQEEGFYHCPFVRELQDCEAFNRRNVGFHCECDSDIEDFHNFFEIIKPETSLLYWDYSVSMLIDLVCSKEEEVLRVILFAKLKDLLDRRRGRSTSIVLCDAQSKIDERRRTRFIFVRGIITTNLDLWGQKIWELESQMFKAKEFHDPKGKQVNLKPFRDSIYIYTYDQLCNVVEDIVSVIESTELV